MVVYQGAQDSEIPGIPRIVMGFLFCHGISGKPEIVMGFFSFYDKKKILMQLIL